MDTEDDCIMDEDLTDPQKEGNTPSSGLPQPSLTHSDDDKSDDKTKDRTQKRRLVIRETPSSHNDDSDDKDKNSFDVVHVTALSPEDDFFDCVAGLDISAGDKCRDMLYRCDVPGLLSGNLTQLSVEEQAGQLLSDLAVVRQKDQPTSNRPILFVAYDIGALVVKTAIVLIMTRQKEYPGLFLKTSHVVFLGCPQRSSSSQAMESKLMEFLCNSKRMAGSHLLTATSIRYLARAIQQTTHAFINSKITLRCHTISVYAAAEPRTIPSVLDSFTATLGVHRESCIQENGPDSEMPISNLKNLLVPKSKNLIPLPQWIPQERTLVSLSATHLQSQCSGLPAPISPLVENAEYLQWEGFMGLRILYLYGTRRDHICNIANQIPAIWKAKGDKKGERSWRHFLFTFDSTDPSRDTLADMVTALVLDIVSEEGRHPNNDDHLILDDLFRFRGGWSEASCLALFDSFRLQIKFNLIMVWHCLDECSPQTRTMLLDFLAKLSERCEMPLKIVVTSRQPAALLPEMGDWVSINMDRLYAHVSPSDAGNEWTTESTPNSLIQQCPAEYDKQHIREGLDRLAAADKNDVHAIVALLCHHTGWPEDPSSEAMALFSDLLHRIHPGDTPQRVLDSILRSNADMDGLRWVLSWLLCAYRPLTLPELSAVLCCYFSESCGCSTELPSQSMMQKASDQLETWLRVLVDFRQGQVRLRDDIRNLLAEDEDSNDYIWNEIRGSAHRTLAAFCLAQLTTEETKAYLDIVVHDYESELQRPPAPDIAPITAPIASDGRGLAFYVVQALPYHLARCPREYIAKALESLIQDPTSQQSYSYTLWAKANWAMSNPFTRSMKPPESALAVLVSHGVIPYDKVKQIDETTRSQCLIAASQNGRHDIAAKFLRHQSHTISTLTDALLSATQAGNEPLALDIAHKMLSISPADEHGTLWPESLIWAAAWLDMDRLADTLLSNGASPDPQTGPLALNAAFCPSVLYVATRIGRTQIVKLLLKNNARTDLLRAGIYDSYFMASGAGVPETLCAYLAKDPSLLRSQKRSPLMNAVQRGCWRYVEALLVAGMDANTKEDRGGQCTPLVLASGSGWPKITKVLLEHNADPNILVSCGHKGENTPLGFAAAGSVSVDCTRLLLQYGGNPNDERFSTPLMYDLCWSSQSCETILAVCDLLIVNDPPIDINLPYRQDGFTPLMVACMNGRLPLVVWLLEHGADVDAVDDENRTALYHTVAWSRPVSDSDRRAVVEKLLEWHPNLETADGVYGETAVHMAFKHPDIVRLLLDAGANPEATSFKGFTLIGIAVWNQATEVVKMLIERKVDLNHINSYGETPIFDAVDETHDASVVRLLAEGGASLRGTSRDETLLECAIKGPPDIMRILLEFRKSLNLEERNSDRKTPLLCVTQSSINMDSVKLLIQAGADINAEDPERLTPLIDAMGLNLPDYVALLLAQPDIDVNRIAPVYGSALHQACSWLNVQAVLSLLSHDADVNATNPDSCYLTPLFSALLCCLDADGSNADKTAKADQIVRILMQHGADIHQVSKRAPYAAIAAACLGAGTSTINLLLDEGASPQQVDPVTGALSLHYAAASGLPSFQTILLPYRGDMMAADRRGKNCLHWAAEFGNARTVAYILDRLGSRATQEGYINRPDQDGWTPLCWALRYLDDKAIWFWGIKSEAMDFTETVRLLLAHGADRTVTCRWCPVEGAEQLTMLELAQRCGASHEIVQQLQAGTEAAAAASYRKAKPVCTYSRWRAECDVCLTQIIGLDYKCNICYDFDACSKCFPSAGDIHNGDTLGDGKQHELKLHPERNEYADPDEHETVSNSPDMNENDLGSMDMDENM